MTQENQSPIVIYEGADKAVEVRLDAEQATVWLTQAQMAELFAVKPQNITMHLRNIYAEEELAEEATCKDFLQVRQEGDREVQRKRKHYSLDAVISVGYRISSARATRFRVWATRILREHLTQGWTINRQRFEANAAELEAALALVRKAAQSPALDVGSGRGLVDIVSRYAQTFLLLQRYDEGLLTDPQAQPGGRLPPFDEARAALDDLKAELMARGEATELFARDRGDGLASLLGNLDQSVSAKRLIPASKQRPPIFSTLWSRTIRLPTATSAAPPSYLWIFCTAMVACLMRRASPSSTMSDWLH